MNTGRPRNSPMALTHSQATTVRRGISLYLTFFLLPGINQAACRPSVVPKAAAEIQDLTRPPAVSAADRPFAGVFAPLDGEWRGQFKIFEAIDGQPPAPARPHDIANVRIAAPPLRLLQTIDVYQHYVSESPYFQRVTIRDTYREGGEERVVESTGANKVQGGELWCIVKKPGETVVHEGANPAPGVLIWRRDLRKPELKIEFFHETVAENAYTIRGWGYYNKDDPERAPRLWFLGEYRRIQ